MRVLIDQAAPVVGDVAGNERALHDAVRAGADAGVRIVVGFYRIKVIERR